MRITTLLNKLIGLQGLWVRGFDYQAHKRRMVLEVVPRRRSRRCGKCGRKAHKGKDRSTRYWRHLDLFCTRTYLRYRIRRVFCRRCGVVTEQVPWAQHASRFTVAFEGEVAWLAQRVDLSAVADYFRVTWRSVRRILHRVVEQQWDEQQRLDGLRVIGVDEISYRKRHRYLTVVVNHLTGRVVWAGKDRKAKTLLRFFRKLGPERAAELEAVSLDMWEPYLSVVRKKAAQARVIFDRFHVVWHLNQAVDETRRQLVRELKGQARRDLKNTKFPLLKAKHNRTEQDRQVLEEQVRANRPLYRAMLLRDDFMDLYTYKREGWANKFLHGWLRRAMRSKLEPIKRVAKMIRNHFDGVVGWVTWSISNGRLEGTNNKIRLLSHRSYGLHSAEALISLVYLCCGGLELQRIH
jgi:transposase